MTGEFASVVCGASENAERLYRSGGRLFDNRNNYVPPSYAYQALLKETDKDILIYVHDDLEIFEPVNRLMKLFLNPNCVAAGLGGATRLGHPDLYKVPYRLINMARFGYASNQVDAEVHGERFTGERRVAVLDAFCMAVRVDWLRTVRASAVVSGFSEPIRLADFGWPVSSLTHHCLDLWLACEAARDGKEIWMAGLECNHHGGGTSIKEVYREATWLQGGTLESDHAIPHRWLYENYSDVLPINVEQPPKTLTFDQVYRTTSRVSGAAALERDECRRYFDLLMEVPEDGRIVEIGLQYGRSSSIVAQVQRFKYIDYFAIDPFTDPPEAKQAWLDLMDRLDCQYILFEGTVETAQKYGYIDLAFIDGDHTEEWVRKDCDFVLPGIKPGGVVCAHDYGRLMHPAVQAAMDAKIAEYGGFEQLPTVRTLASWRKLA